MKDKTKQELKFTSGFFIGMLFGMFVTLATIVFGAIRMILELKGIGLL